MKSGNVPVVFQMSDYTPKARATRQRILTAASELMLNKGFTRTKLDEVLEKSKVRKGNFYYYFASKDELGLAVLKETAAPIIRRWLGQLIVPEADPRDNLRNLASGIADSSEIISDMGNPVVNLSCEMVELSDDFRRAVSEILEEVRDIFMKEFARLQKLQPLPGGRGAEELAWYAISLLDGAVLIYRRRKDVAMLRRTIQIGMGFLLGEGAVDKSTV